jgi:hypothetical protein
MSKQVQPESGSRLDKNAPSQNDSRAEN